jgi:hypothetical protein
MAPTGLTGCVKARQERRLLRALQRIAGQAQSKDARLLKEMEKCPSSKTACAILTDALNASRSVDNRDELLRPEASWIHPLF